MTNEQLYISVGIPSVLIVVSWLLQNQRFNSLEKRLDDLSARIAGIEVAIRGLYESKGSNDEAIATLKAKAGLR